MSVASLYPGHFSTQIYADGTDRYYCIAVVVSCLPSFRAFLSNRTSSYWKDRYTSSDSRLSRLSRTPKGTVRLDTFASPGGSPPDTSALQNPGRGLENVTGLTSSGMRTGYTAVAECMHPYETIFRDRGDSESEENILPIMPQDSVHVRNDFVSLVTTSTYSRNVG